MVNNGIQIVHTIFGPSDSEQLLGSHIIIYTNFSQLKVYLNVNLFLFVFLSH